MTFTRIGVLGAGNIGTGVATDLVLHGLEAVVVDIDETVLERAGASILQNVRSAPLLSRSLPRVPVDDARRRLTLTTALATVASCDFIVENVTEDWEVKRPLYERLDRLVPADVCFGVNTSCIPITKVAAATSRPERVVGVHFMNPVHLMPTVEAIRGRQTSERTLDALAALLSQLGKTAVVVNDQAGFVSNRISHLFMNEAAYVLQDGIASPEAVDEIFRKCFGHRMGPLETADLIGLDTVVRSLDVLFDHYADQKYRCAPLLRTLVSAGHLGRKSGRGFHVYPTV